MMKIGLTSPRVQRRIAPFAKRMAESLPYIGTQKPILELSTKIAGMKPGWATIGVEELRALRALHGC